MIVAPDDSYSVAEAGDVLRRSERQVLRYLTSGRLRGSQASARWTVTALQIWAFQSIADEMLASWRDYCRTTENESEMSEKNQCTEAPGE